MKWHGAWKLNSKVNFQDSDDFSDTSESLQKRIYPSKIPKKKNYFYKMLAKK